MANLNEVMVIGNVGTEPEMRFTPNDNPVTSFRVATNHTYTTPEGERKQETEWFTIVTWNRLAELCNQFLFKGRRVYVEGRFHTDTWESQDDQRHYRSEIVANQVLFLDRRSTTPSPEERAQKAGTGEPEDIPF